MNIIKPCVHCCFLIISCQFWYLMCLFHKLICTWNARSTLSNRYCWNLQPCHYYYITTISHYHYQVSCHIIFQLSSLSLPRYSFICLHLDFSIFDQPMGWISRPSMTFPSSYSFRIPKVIFTFPSPRLTCLLYPILSRIQYFWAWLLHVVWLDWTSHVKLITSTDSSWSTPPVWYNHLIVKLMLIRLMFSLNLCCHQSYLTTQLWLRWFSNKLLLHWFLLLDIV